MALQGLARLAKGYVEIHDLLFLIIIYIYYILSRPGEALRGHAWRCKALLGLLKVM